MRTHTHTEQRLKSSLGLSRFSKANLAAVLCCKQLLQRWILRVLLTRRPVEALHTLPDPWQRRPRPNIPRASQGTTVPLLTATVQSDSDRVIMSNRLIPLTHLCMAPAYATCMRTTLANPFCIVPSAPPSSPASPLTGVLGVLTARASARCTRGITDSCPSECCKSGSHISKAESWN